MIVGLDRDAEPRGFSSVGACGGTTCVASCGCMTGLGTVGGVDGTA
jgi:hypothetical protein